jgi:hypothetical protein
VHGEEFPELRILAEKATLDVLSQCFDRPAFTTPFWREVSIPDFEKAITDTIEVLNTGVHRLRDGTFIKKIPSRYELVDPVVKQGVAEIYKLVVKLRDNFVALKRSKDIKPCECNEPDCPVYIVSDKACKMMDNIRQQIFTEFRAIKADFALAIE